jgi:hypothetical protein
MIHFFLIALGLVILVDCFIDVFLHPAPVRRARRRR